MNKLDSLRTASMKQAGRPGGTLYPPDLFNAVTDILADLVLEDLKEHTSIPMEPQIDRFSERENTSL